jgi:hypothetical protein
MVLIDPAPIKPASRRDTAARALSSVDARPLALTAFAR